MLVVCLQLVSASPKWPYIFIILRLEMGQFLFIVMYKSGQVYSSNLLYCCTYRVYFNLTFTLVFKFFTGPRADEKTWFEARDYCKAIGGDLLSIHNDAELRVGRYAAVKYYFTRHQ